MKGFLIDKINQKTAKIGILGLGYVGLPHLVDFLEEGFLLTGYDIDKDRVNSLNRQVSYIDDISSNFLEKYKKNYLATDNFSSLTDQDIIFIDVPTPIKYNKTPDLSYIQSAINSIMKYSRRGQLIILESTVPPGTTKKYLVDKLNKKGFNLGQDIFVGYSPERIDPGNKSFKTKDITRIISGYTSNCLDLMEVLFGERGWPVTNLETAELTKLYENTFRFINIAFANDVSNLTDKMNISFDEVSNAANSKPYGFMKFNPSYGIGGHCIPIDPYYLLDFANTNDVRLTTIENASNTNDIKIYRLMDKIHEFLFKNKIKNPNIALIGASYKPNISDTRMALVHNLSDLLVEASINFEIFDNIDSNIKIGNSQSSIIPISYKTINKFDLAIILQEHDYIDLSKINISKIFATRF